ncbi:Protein-lysine N-methyltransferase efm5 [Savitreella phatthalungensis]
MTLMLVSRRGHGIARCCSIKANVVAVGTAQRRGVADIMISRTGKTIMRHGSGDRSAVSGHTATVFGATGFLGRYLVSRLAKQGTTVIIPHRDDMRKRDLKVSGDLGQVIPMEFALTNRQSIEEAVRHSNIVYNLIGRDYETKNFDFEQVHVQGARRIAEACAKYDVDRFVHVSALGANPASTSQFLKTKAFGEQAVREVYPEATIVRPAVIYGVEDRFLNNLATAKTILTVNHMKETVYPAFVRDVAVALEAMMHNDNSTGQTYELRGRDPITVAKISELVAQITLKKPRHYNMPKAPMQALASVLDKVLWWNIASADQIERQFIDEKPSPAGSVLGFSDLGVQEQQLGPDTMKYLRMYRSNTYYDEPLTGEEGKYKPGVVHVTD